MQAGRCLGVKRGTIKGDIVIHKGTPYIIELATRLSGGWMSSDQIPLATGINIIKIAIKIALGEHVNIDEIKIKKKNSVVIRYFFPEENKCFNFKTPKIKSNRYVKKYKLYLKNKTIVDKVSDHTKRAGFVITVASNKKKAILEAKKFINLSIK